MSPVIFFAEFEAEAAAESGLLLDPAVAEAGADQVGKGEEAVFWGVDWSILLCPVMECLWVEFEVVELAL